MPNANDPRRDQAQETEADRLRRQQQENAQRQQEQGQRQGDAQRQQGDKSQSSDQFANKNPQQR